jgi:hypothetical protein
LESEFSNFKITKSGLSGIPDWEYKTYIDGIEKNRKNIKLNLLIYHE